MSNELKCPFCQQELKISGHELHDLDLYCDKCEPFRVGNKELWQELITTRKALEQSEICCTEWEKQALDYKAENIALSGDLERTRKALDVALDWLEQVATPAKCDDDLCREFTKRKLAEIKTIFRTKGIVNIKI